MPPRIMLTQSEKGISRLPCLAACSPIARRMGAHVLSSDTHASASLISPSSASLISPSAVASRHILLEIRSTSQTHQRQGDLTREARTSQCTSKIGIRGERLQCTITALVSNTSGARDELTRAQDAQPCNAFIWPQNVPHRPHPCCNPNHTE